MKVLVIDDELGLRHTLSLILASDGHEVAVAADGAACPAGGSESDPSTAVGREPAIASLFVG